ncbi:MAG TPA: hypothetical protein VLA36_09800, partial [Longimicrobiales bacterium]|nr:hypothetical protein [Longimicrobiales bacterium]
MSDQRVERHDREHRVPHHAGRDHDLPNRSAMQQSVQPSDDQGGISGAQAHRKLKDAFTGKMFHTRISAED